MSWLAPWRLLVDEEPVHDLAAAVDPRFRALVLLLRHTGLAWGEAVALRRRCCFVAEGSIEVVEQAVVTPAGVRFRRLCHDGWVSVRDAEREALAEHLTLYVPERRQSLVFTDFFGEALSSRWFREAVWLPALAACGLPDELSVDDLQVARLRAWQIEVGAQRAELRGGAR